MKNLPYDAQQYLFCNGIICKIAIIMIHIKLSMLPFDRKMECFLSKLPFPIEQFVDCFKSKPFGPSLSCKFTNLCMHECLTVGMHYTALEWEDIQQKIMPLEEVRSHKQIIPNNTWVYGEG